MKNQTCIMRKPIEPMEIDKFCYKHFFDRSDKIFNEIEFIKKQDGYSCFKVSHYNKKHNIVIKNNKIYDVYDLESHDAFDIYNGAVYKKADNINNLCPIYHSDNMIEMIDIHYSYDTTSTIKEFSEADKMFYEAENYYFNRKLMINKNHGESLEIKAENYETIYFFNNSFIKIFKLKEYEMCRKDGIQMFYFDEYGKILLSDSFRVDDSNRLLPFSYWVEFSLNRIKTEIGNMEVKHVQY